MKKKYFILAGISLMLMTWTNLGITQEWDEDSDEAPAVNLDGVITEVIDGDTVHFETVYREPVSYKVRMIGVDTPETHLVTRRGVVGQGYWGEAATAFLNKLIPVGTEVTLENYGLDKYGRTLGRIFFEDHDVNLAMVKNGWGIPYIICPENKCSMRYLEREKVKRYFSMCEEARSNERGVFNPERPLRELPFEFRLRMQGRRPDKWVGDFRSRMFFSPNEYRKTDVCWRVFFWSREDALRAGFHPAENN